MSFKKLVLATILGGVVAFVWGAISWIALPWHHKMLHTFTNEDAVVAAIRSNAPRPGVYFLPNLTETASEQERAAREKAVHDRMRQGPVVFAAVQLMGRDPSSPFLYLGGLLIEFVGAFFASWLVLSLASPNYGTRVKTVMLAALFAGAVGYLPNWHWWGFSTGYTLLTIMDRFIAWLLAGLVIARIAK